MTEYNRRIGIAINVLFTWGVVPISIVFAVGLGHGYLTGGPDPFGWIIVGVAVAVVCSLCVGALAEIDTPGA